MLSLILAILAGTATGATASTRLSQPPLMDAVVVEDSAGLGALTIVAGQRTLEMRVVKFRTATPAPVPGPVAGTQSTQKSAVPGRAKWSSMIAIVQPTLMVGAALRKLGGEPSSVVNATLHLGAGTPHPITYVLHECRLGYSGELTQPAPKGAAQVTLTCEGWQVQQ